MKKIKSFFNTCLVCLLLVGTFCLGFNFLNKPTSTNAFSSIENTAKNYPEYLKVNNKKESEVTSEGNNSTFFFPNTNSTLSFTIADQYIFGEDRVNTDAGVKSGYNYAYVPSDPSDTDKPTTEEANPSEYSYFRFTSALTLNYNVSNTSAPTEQQLKNILQDQPLSNFAKNYSPATSTDNDYGPYPINETLYSTIVPEKLNISFRLDPRQPDVTIDESDKSIVTLNQEGMYTLTIIGEEYRTTDQGQSFSAPIEVEIHYTFFVFNTNTYNMEMTNNIEWKNTAQARVTSTTHSQYHYYNYSTTALASIKYDPTKYQISLDYTAPDQTIQSVTFEYDFLNKSFSAKDSSGSETTPPCFARLNPDDNMAYLTFNTIGTYDLSFEYIYFNKLDSTVYNVPLNKSILRQRLYVYGFQAMYTPFDQEDETTHQSVSLELKDFDKDNSTFSDTSADVTHFYTGTKEQAGQILTSKDVAKNVIDTLVNGDTAPMKDYTPITTNQTPLTFNSNVNLARYNGSGDYLSYVFKKDEGTWTYQKTFTPFDFFNDAGDYFVLMDYTFSEFRSQTGTNQGGYHHLQVFRFTITNINPSIDVFSDEHNEIDTRGFTNQGVYIIDKSSSSPYDAEPRITITAENYNASPVVNFFDETNIKDFNGQFGLTYRTNIQKTEFTTDEDDRFENANYRGLHISTNEGQLLNARFIVKTYAPNATSPSIRTFTIDTTPISSILAYNAEYAEESRYVIKDGVGGDNIKIANGPVVFSWKEKNSGAITTGKVQFFALSNIDYYSTNLVDTLVSRLIDNNGSNYNLLPANVKLDLSKTEDSYVSDWDVSPCYNANSALLTNSKLVDSAYVKSLAGLYIIEVRDSAGNCNYEVVFIDNTSPLFVKKRVADNGANFYSIAQMNETIPVVENEDVYIMWGDKGIYIDGFDAFYKNDKYTLHSSSNLPADDELLYKKLDSIFNAPSTNNKTDRITKISDITFNSTEGLNYNSRYLRIKINELYYLMDADSNDYSPSTTMPYKIEFFYANRLDEADHQIAREGTYIFLVRDEFNTAGGDELDQYKNHPSGYLSINVSSDSSQLKVIDSSGGELPKESHSLTGYYYNHKRANDNSITNKNSTKEKEDLATPTIDTTKNYKYAYYRPTFGKSSLTLSFKPNPLKGGKVKSVVMYYYPFNLESKDTTYEMYNSETGKIEEFTAKAYYYTLSQDPTRTNIIYNNENSDYEADKTFTQTITFDSSDLPSPGKYVFVRTYSDSSEIDEYDYLERDLTLIVDNEKVLSVPQEVTRDVEEGESVKHNVSLESVVGGDMLVSMFSNADQGAVQVAFPYYSHSSGLSMELLASQENVGTDQTLEARFKTNKLPLSVLIPQQKYTTYYDYDLATNSYSVNDNKRLSTFGEGVIVPLDDTYQEVKVNADGNIVGEDGVELRPNGIPVKPSYWAIKYNEGALQTDTKTTTESFIVGRYVSRLDAEQALASMQMVEYKLSATISFTPTGASVPTRFYRTNGTGTSGYLNFYEVSRVDVSPTASSTWVQDFKSAGTYQVDIYQASNLGSTSTLYTQGSYSFKFTIAEPEPNFDIISENTGEALRRDFAGNYYTNTPDLLINWNDEDSRYLADIDLNSISITTSFSAAPLTFDSLNAKGLYSKTGTLHSIRLDLTDKELFANYGGREFFTNSNWLRIKMSLEGYENNEAGSIEKTIIIDYSAPVERLGTLMNNVTSTYAPFTRLYQETNMRELYGYNGDLIETGLWEAGQSIQNYMSSVSVTNPISDGELKFYSYNVPMSFFANLTPSTNPTTETYEIYLREIDLNAYTPDSSFVQSQYKTLSEIELAPNRYYEIVELDLARNRSVYIVHVYNETTDENALQYSNNTSSDTLSSQQLMNTNTIYSTLGFKITALNFLQDPWGIYRITTNNVTSSTKVYMKSPWKEDTNTVLELNAVGNTIELVETPIEALLDDVRNMNLSQKHAITFTNRFTATTTRVQLAIMDAQLSINDPIYNAENYVATFSFNAIPTKAQADGQIGYVYPVNIKVERSTGSEWRLLIDMENKSGDPTLWTSTPNSPVSFNYINGTPLGRLEINTRVGTAEGVKLRYTITDNFGNVYTRIQLAKSITYPEFENRSGRQIIYDTLSSDSYYLTWGESSYQYDDREYKVSVARYNARTGTYEVIKSTDDIDDQYFSNNHIKTIPFPYTKYEPTATLTGNYDYRYKLSFWDTDEEIVDTNPMRVIYVRLYNRLPLLLEGNRPSGTDTKYLWFWSENNLPLPADLNTSSREVAVNYNGRVYRATPTYLTTYSETVRLFYDRQEDTPTQALDMREYGYKVLISANGGDFVEVTSGEGDYSINGAGNYRVLVVYNNLFTDACKIFDLTILNAREEFYNITLDNRVIQKSSFHLELPNIPPIYEVYIVPIENSERSRLQVLPNTSDNEDMKTTIVGPQRYTKDGKDILVYSYQSKFVSGQFAIILMGRNEHFLDNRGLSYETNAGKVYITPNEQSQLSITASENEEFGQVKISWRAYNTMKENRVNIEVLKNFEGRDQVVNLTIYESADKEEYYTYITRSGTYRIRFYDSCQPANNQLFGNNYTYLAIVFLKDVPFVVSYSEIDGEVITKEPINKQVFNSDVTITLVDVLSYLRPSEGINIEVTKNGTAYTGYRTQNYSYIFSESGFYTFKISATTRNSIVLKPTTYSFTILSPNESRFAFEFSPYANYYIESVIKNYETESVDITQNLVNYTNDGLRKIDDKLYMTRLMLSCFDSLAGQGRYTITINTGDPTYSSIVLQRFTFDIWININTPPVDVSVNPGETTSDTIKVTFNAQEIYRLIGDCYVKIGNTRYDITKQTVDSYGTENTVHNITSRGTYYIQIYTISDNLYFSYKVIKTDPLNVWAIIAIVVGVIAVLAVVIITIKLRKRLKAK